jgi:hypothetical protein
MAVERWTDEIVDKLADSVQKLGEDIGALRDESKEQSIRFAAYQQAWVCKVVCVSA